MATLQFPNIIGQFQQGQEYGRQIAERNRKAEQQSRLSSLASQAYGASGAEREGLIGQAVGVDPEAGLALQKGLSGIEDQRTKDLVQAARFLKAAPEGAKGAAWATLRPALAGRYADLQLPDQYTPELDQYADAIISANQAEAGGAKVVGNALVSDTGQVIYQAPQILNTDQGVFEYTGGSGGGVRPLRAPSEDAAAAPAESPLVEGPSGEMGRYSIGADGRPVFITATTTPQDAAAIQANEAAFAASDNVRLPPQGEPLRPKGASAEQRRLQLAEDTARRAEAAARRQEETARRLEETATRQTAGQQFSNEQSLRKEVTDVIKEPRQILSAYSRVKAAANNPNAANDLALIFGYMKMLDPGSVVREGEFANAQNAASVPQQIANVYNRALSGERLSPEQRAQFVQSAAQIAGTADARIAEVARDYRARAADYGFDPKRATGLDDPDAGSTGNVARPTTEAEYNALPSGALFIDPDDGRQYRKP